MKIVVLDGYCLNPGDLTWDDWKEFGEVVVYDRTPPSETVARAKDAEVAITNKTVLNRAVIAALPKLKYVGMLATGYNVVDVQAAAERNIPVTNVPTYGTDSVAEHTFALLFELVRRTGMHSDLVRAGEWARSPDFSFWRAPLVELSGKTMGIVGFGRIGFRVGQIAQAMRMEVLACDKERSYSLNGHFDWVSLDGLLAKSDVVSLHCPLFPDTQNMINRKSLAQMKPSAFLINTSRGGLVVDRDLADALNAGKLAGAALDVLSIEPPAADNPLLAAKNCIITPHFAWATREARARLMDTALENLKTFLAGKPQNVVNSRKT